MNIQFISQSYRLQKAFEAPPVRNAPSSVRSAPMEKNVESVQISSDSQSIQKIMEKIKSLPEVRIPLVDELRQRIKNNDYPIKDRFDSALESMFSKGIL